MVTITGVGYFVATGKRPAVLEGEDASPGGPNDHKPGPDTLL